MLLEVEKLQPEGGCSDLPKLGLVSLGLYFNVAAVAIARGQEEEEGYFPVGAEVLGR